MSEFPEKLSRDICVSIFKDLENTVDITNTKPLLAHYTSIPTLECIMNNDEIWFSNPLKMNDIEEVLFGLNNRTDVLLFSDKIRSALRTNERRRLFEEALRGYYHHYGDEHAFDTYVFCLSEHDEGDTDGTLSMWRGYGGYGNGAAIVFDTSKIGVQEDSPLAFAPVQYGTREKRFSWFDQLSEVVADTAQQLPIPDECVWLLSYHAFERLKLIALFTKHDGFREEREWRIVYMPERDTGDGLTEMLSYSIGPRGVEPRLKFKIAPLDGYTSPDLSLSKIVHSIILGPTASSLISRKSVHRMLEKAKKPELKDRVRSSSIPFRSP